MPMSRYHPLPPLDRFIECFWWSHRDEPQDEAEHMLPSGAAQLVFALHEQPILCRASSSAAPSAWVGSIVHGPQSSYYLAGPKPKGGSVGIAFRPGAAAALLGVSTTELADRHVPLEAIWGARGVTLWQRLLDAGDPASMFRILEQSLSERLHRPLLMHPVIAAALALRGEDGRPARVADLQRASGYSAKHFIALFSAAVGINPKHYSRIQRFNGAARRMAQDGEQSLADIAAAHGYADQAHLTREFKAFAGVTPGRYRPGAGRPLHHRAPATFVRAAR